MNDHPTPTPEERYRRALAVHRRDERLAWDRYAAAVVAESCDEDYAAEQADKMLDQRRKRYPGPKREEHA